MFPTWPAKSEMTKKSNRHKSPSAPEGGAFLLNQVKIEVQTTIILTAITTFNRIKMTRMAFILLLHKEVKLQLDQDLHLNSNNTFL